MELRFWAATDVGRVRDHNEDNFLVDKKLQLFVVCDGAYGAGRVLRQPNPDTPEALLDLAEADGVHDVHDEDGSGWRQLALVTDEFRADNRGAPHPDHPANHAACYDGEAGGGGGNGT